MGNQVTHTKTLDTHWNWLYKVSSAAAVWVGILLLIAMLALIATVLEPARNGSWLPAVQENWLIVVFKLHAGFSGVQTGLLRVLDLPDIAILALVAIMYLGLYVALRRTSRVWSIVAAIQPFLGIALFIATRTAGRSSVMGATLVISLVMLWSSTFKKMAASLGILASVLLLSGDFTAGAIPPSTIMATLVGIGYVLLIVWNFLVARKLLQLGQGGSEATAQ
jgi:hypothetical protein